MKRLPTVILLLRLILGWVMDFQFATPGNLKFLLDDVREVEGWELKDPNFDSRSGNINDFFPLRLDTGAFDIDFNCSTEMEIIYEAKLEW